MVFRYILPTLARLWPWLLVAVVLARLCYLRYQRGLAKYPGPFLATFTNLWRISDLYFHPNSLQMPAYHERYGKIMRIGPRALSFSEPEAVRDIYSHGWDKSEFYDVFAGQSKGVLVRSLLSTTEEARHSKFRRAVNSAFPMSTIIQYEPFVDATLEVFLEQMDRICAGNGVVDFSEWLLFYAVDVIGELMYGARHGLLEAGKDKLGIIAAMQSFMYYSSLVGTMPSLDTLMWKNPILMWLNSHGWLNKPSPTVPFALKHLKQRLSTDTEEKGSHTGPTREDLLAKFLNAKRDHPDVLSDIDVFAMTVSMVNAGSDSTGIALSALFYSLLKNPRCLGILQEELDDKLPKNGSDSCKYITSWVDSQKLPYLDACFKESFRLHPGFGVVLERVVPPSGAKICGEWIHGGTIVGCHTWVLGRHKETFGEDVEAFRPERWLEDDVEKAAMMNRALLQFGAGSRTCIGKNISLLEMYKLVPSFLKTFRVRHAIPIALDVDIGGVAYTNLSRGAQITLENPEKEWTLFNQGFIDVSDVNVRIERR